VEVLRRSCWVRNMHIDIDICAVIRHVSIIGKLEKVRIRICSGDRSHHYLKHSLDTRGRVFRACTIQAVRQHHHNTTLLQPFCYLTKVRQNEYLVARRKRTLSGRNKGIDNDLGITMNAFITVRSETLTCAPLKKSPN
jgi:hypothetical protein